MEFNNLLSLRRVEWFCLFFACNYTSMEATVLSVRYGSACLKFFEVTNFQYLWKGLSALVMFCM